MFSAYYIKSTTTADLFACGARKCPVGERLSMRPGTPLINSAAIERWDRNIVWAIVLHTTNG